MGRRLGGSLVVLLVSGLLVPGLIVLAPARPAAGHSIETSPNGTQRPTASARTSPDQPRLLVRFRPEATPAARDAAIASIGGRVDRVLNEIAVTRVAIRIPTDPTGDEAGLTALRLARDPAVLSVEPDATGSVQLTPNDPFYLTDPASGLGQWGIRKAHVDQAWDIARGSASITVAVIDTGIDANHPDLAGVTLPGVTFLTAPDPTCPAGSTIDDDGHGTHVAGVIAANGNNGIGIAGVAFGVKILPIKALDCQGAGLMSDVASGVIWATDHGARVINISLGSSAAQLTLQDAIRYAIAHNVIVVAAAGNCGVLSIRCTTLNEAQYPGAFPEVLAVAATDENDGHASFSNEGPYVGVSAPGVRIYSTTPTYPTTLSQSNPGTTSYASFSGTSQASPFVAGVAALILSRAPGLSVAQLIDLLKSTADDLGSPGADTLFGAGRVNALRAVSATVRYGAAYDVTGVPKTATFTAPITAPVTVTNLSSFAWPAGGTSPVRLAYHWIDLAGNTVVWDGQRSPLPADVPIGGSATLNVTIRDAEGARHLCAPARPRARGHRVVLVQRRHDRERHGRDHERSRRELRAGRERAIDARPRPDHVLGDREQHRHRGLAGRRRDAGAPLVSLARPDRPGRGVGRCARCAAGRCRAGAERGRRDPDRLARERRSIHPATRPRPGGRDVVLRAGRDAA